MPDEAAGTETDFVTLLLEAPADVHVVAGFAENGIEAGDVFEGPFVEGHVAAGNVFGETIGEHDVRGTAGRSHHAGGDPGIVGWKKVVAADTGEFALEEIANQIIEPI